MVSGGKVNWGILSTANIGINRVIPAIGENPSGRVVAIASRSLGKAREVAGNLGIPQSYGSYSELLDSPEIDAVYIPLPNSMHCEFTVLAAEKGKHVLCEKPLALDSQECKEMISACEENDVLLMEAFMYRFHPQIAKLKELLDAGKIGTLSTMRATFRIAMSDLNDIRYQKELGGGALYDIGCYCVSSMRLLVGAEPISVQGTARFNDQKGVDETFVGMLRFPGLELGLFDCAFRSSLLQTLELVGDGGTLELSDPFVAGDSPTILKHGAEPETFRVEKANSYQLMVEHFNQCILNDEKPRYSANDGLRNMRVIDTLYKSAEEC
jgi:xylose dehydrogenase (NAD/NADP)